MKKTIYALVLMAGAGTVLTSCETPAQKESAAETKVDSAEAQLQEAKDNLNAEYPAFKKEADEKIVANDKRIAELRAEADKSGTHLDGLRAQKVDSLESANAELKSRLYGYEKERSDWEAFKMRFRHDMDNLTMAVRDFGRDMKK